LFDPILILVAQHWFVLLKYLHDVPYIIIETILEVLFQWSVVSQMEPLVYLHPWLGYAGACGMMVAHWLYFIAGFIGRFVVHEEPRKGQSTLVMNARRESMRHPSCHADEDNGVVTQEDRQHQEVLPLPSWSWLDTEGAL